jgi:hypothetical protein
LIAELTKSEDSAENDLRTEDYQPGFDEKVRMSAFQGRMTLTLGLKQVQNCPDGKWPAGCRR